MGGTAQKIQSKNDDEDDAGVDGVHVSRVPELGELGAAILQWERKLNKMMDEQQKKTNIPQMWKMAALMKMCPKETKK